MLKQESVPVPEAVAHFRAETLVDGALHAALHRSTEGLPMFAQQRYLQAVFSLANHCAGGGPRLDFDATIGCQTVLPTTMEDGTDASGEAAHRQGNRRDGKHLLRSENSLRSYCLFSG